MPALRTTGIHNPVRLRATITSESGEQIGVAVIASIRLKVSPDEACEIQALPISVQPIAKLNDKQMEVWLKKLYGTKVTLRIDVLSDERWRAIRRDCGGHIDSLVELLQGKLSRGVMDVVTRPGEGLFPAPAEIPLDCSCPDWAVMCKHVAGALYGVGARLDSEPEMLFSLRGVDPAEMIADAVGGGATHRKKARGRVLEDDVLSSVFGVDIDLGGEALTGETKPKHRRRTKDVSEVKAPPSKKLRPSTPKSDGVCPSASAMTSASVRRPPAASIPDAGSMRRALT